jgi:2',3'-cyclic-nucleotide 2'-phosphodiesterase (5'-nucleotidase family)
MPVVRALVNSFSISWIALLATLLMIVPVKVESQEVTILYTNDIESVYDPVPAFWLENVNEIGGLAKLATLIEQRRQMATSSFLLDAGDMFTGSLSKATQGRLVFDLYNEIGFDAVNLGNHEFEYGWPVLRKVMQRAQFPVLNANIFYAGTDIPIARQYSILEHEGVRLGVVGLMGEDAFINTMMKANRQGLEIRDLLVTAQHWVDELAAQVDMVVLLTHQGKTAPMQTDKEADPEVQRGIDDDYQLAGAIQGVDLIVSGHSDNGLWQPVIHPDTGTVIVQTFGQGHHLGLAKFTLSESARPKLVSAELVPVIADSLEDHPGVSGLILAARTAHPSLMEVAGRLSHAAIRRYYRESSIGNLLADILMQSHASDIGMITPGAIRADLPAGEVTREMILNTFPFLDKVTVLELPGAVLIDAVEHGLQREYGLPQYAGLTLQYDLTKPAGQRLVDLSISGQAIKMDRTYRLVTGSFTATGGEGYDMFPERIVFMSDELVSTVFVNYFQQQDQVMLPDTGRQRLVQVGIKDLENSSK